MLSGSDCVWAQSSKTYNKRNGGAVYAFKSTKADLIFFNDFVAVFLACVFELMRNPP